MRVRFSNVSHFTFRENTAVAEASSYIEDNDEDSDGHVEEVDSCDSSDEQDCLNPIVQLQTYDSDNHQETDPECLNPIEDSETRSSFDYSEQNDFIVVDPGNIDQKFDRQIGRKCKYMTEEERIESKRRRDREYRQRKRLRQDCVEQNDRQMGRKAKYSTEEERLESKRRRDAKYRQRLRMKKLAQDQERASDDGEQLSDNPSQQFQVKTELECPETDIKSEPDTDKKQVFIKTEIEECSLSADELSSNWDISVEVEKRPATGRKYFTEEERILAKRRRDAEYRERLRLKKLVVDTEGDLEEVAEPIVIQLSKISPQSRTKYDEDQQELTSEDEKYEPEIVIEPYSEDSANGEAPYCKIDPPSKGRKYFTQEERTKAKLRRNAEYRQRLKMKKLKEEEELDDAFSLQMSSSSNDFKSKRQKYFTEEERLAAKRRRDAEYRERLRVKKLMDDADAATDGTEKLEQASSTYSLSESQHSEECQESEQGCSNTCPDETRGETNADRKYTDSENGCSNSSLQNESMASQYLNTSAQEVNQSSECDNSTPTGSKVIQKRPQKYFTEEERIAGKRRRDAEYRERKRMKKLMVDAANGKTVATLDTTSHSESRINHSESEAGWDQLSLQEESLEFRLRGSDSNHTSIQGDELNRYSNSNLSRRRYNTEEERLAAKRRRDAEYRERKRLQKFNSQGDINPISTHMPASRTTSSSNHEDSNSIVSDNSPFQRKYFTAEERLAAKRRRDAEYRERKRLQKLNFGTINHISTHMSASRTASSSNHDNSNLIASDHTPFQRKYFTEEERLAAKRRRDAEYRERQRLKKLQIEPVQELRDSDYEDLELAPDADEIVQDSDCEQTVEVAAEFAENAAQSRKCQEANSAEEKLRLKRVRNAAAKRAKRLRDKLSKGSVILTPELKSCKMFENNKIESRSCKLSESEKIEAKRKRDREYRCLF